MFAERSRRCTGPHGRVRFMPLLRCSSCRALVELARPVTVDRCANCGGVLLPSDAPQAVLEDEPTRPRVLRSSITPEGSMPL